MLKISRKEAFRRCKALLKYGLVLLVCYWGVDFYIEWEAAAERRAIYQKEQGDCSKKLAGMEQVPIRGGSLLDRTRIPGFYFGSTLKSDGSCIADVLEGSFWWTGTELRTEYELSGIEKPSNWGYFQVAARLYTRKERTEPHTMGGRHVDWPDDLIVKLKKYPGLELWLDASPPSSKNDFLITTFVMHNWRRHDGTPRTISCDGLNYPGDRVKAAGLGRQDLLKLNKAQLENLDFGELQTRCTVELYSFDFSGGDGRVSLSTRSLRGAPEALKFVSEYLSRSIIAGK
ncbi:hypothetical protein [Pseudomonas sp. H1h]|uniref:hypothetical protein n=1 Tax=Pseudomonas sp. H1h TaxID=1397280 RepID=UPI00046A532A|nr:hypothetical protein [Pseudomonas sp. H1h]